MDYKAIGIIVGAFALIAFAMGAIMLHGKVEPKKPEPITYGSVFVLSVKDKPLFDNKTLQREYEAGRVIVERDEEE